MWKHVEQQSFHMTDAEYMEQLAAVSGLISEWVRTQDFPFTHAHTHAYTHKHTYCPLQLAVAQVLTNDHETKQGLAEYVREQIRETSQRPVLVCWVHACGLVVRVDLCHSKLL
jgi:ferritin